MKVTQLWNDISECHIWKKAMLKMIGFLVQEEIQEMQKKDSDFD
jgi:hypothetical protein